MEGWKHRRDVETDCREKRKSCHGSMFVERMKDVYVVLKAYGTGRRSQTGSPEGSFGKEDLTMPDFLNMDRIGKS